MRLSLRVISSIGVLGALLVSQARAGVIVVDPGGGPGQALLQEAIDSAADGDVIVLKLGDYDSLDTPITIDGKAITIAADTQFPQLVRGAVVSGVPAGRAVVLEFLYLGLASGTAPNFTSGLVADLSGGGELRLQDCFASGAPGEFPASGDVPSYPAAVISGDGTATLDNCQLFGGDGHFHLLDAFGEHHWAQAGAPALVADGPRVALYGCQLTGGDGGSGPDAGSDPLPDGAAALIVRNGTFVLAYGGSFTGGAEGGNPEPGCTSGDGATVEAGGQLWVRGATLVAGGVQAPGTAGQPIALLGGSSTTFAEPAQTFFEGSDHVYREGGNLVLGAFGQPGDAVALLVSIQSGFVPLPKVQGVLGLSPTFFLGPIPIGVLNAQGWFQVPALVPQLPAGFDSLLVFAQSVELTAGGAMLGPVRSIVLLDSTIR